jgi:hypothetical protein
VLVAILLVNVALLVPAQGTTLRLDVINPSLPEIHLRLPRLADLPFLRSLASQLSERASAQGSSPFAVWIGPSATPSVEGHQPLQAEAEPVAGGARATLTPPAGASPLPSATQPQTGTVSPSASPTLSVTTSVTAASSITPSATAQSTASATPSPTTPTATADSGATHYVATNGDDSGPGSSSQPWKTIQKAASSLGPGSTAIVLSGDYPERVQVTRSGGSGAPITFKAQGKVTMKGFTVKADYIAIIGFDISNTPDSGTDGVGIFVQGSDCDIEDNYVHFATRGGIVLWADAGQYSKTSDCVVRNNRLYRNALMGISVMGQDNLVEDNEIWGTIQYHPNWHNPPSWVDADGITFFGSGHVFRGNYIHDIHYGIPENPNPHIDCFQTYGGDKVAGHDILFDGNYCDEPDTLPELSLAAKAFQVEGGAHDLMIRNNITVSNLVAIFNSSHDISILNNTFIGNPDSDYSQGIQLIGSPNFTIENNIFAYQENGTGSLSLDRASGSGLEVGYNCVYRTSGDPPRPADPNDVWGLDPLFVGGGDYHLKAASPCVDTGKDLGSDVRRDYDGKRRPRGSGYDIGAYER